MLSFFIYKMIDTIMTCLISKLLIPLLLCWNSFEAKQNLKYKAYLHSHSAPILYDVYVFICNLQTAMSASQ